MRSASNLLACLALFGATACTTIYAGAEPEPEPSAVPSSGTSGRRSTAATLGIPPGHLPAAGQCKVWIPGKPPGHQASSRDCRGIERQAPADSWILYRPGKDKKVVHVRVVDARRAGIVIRTRVYDVKTGTYLRDE